MAAGLRANSLYCIKALNRQYNKRSKNVNTLKTIKKVCEVNLIIFLSIIREYRISIIERNKQIPRHSHNELNKSVNIANKYSAKFLPIIRLIIANNNLALQLN